jgi:TolA-binding protein
MSVSLQRTLRRLFCALLLAAGALSSGCAMWPRQQAQDPFLQQAKKQSAESPDGSRVVQASNEVPAADSGNSEVLSSDTVEVRPPDPEGWEKWQPENVSKSLKKAVGLGPEYKIARPAFIKGKQLYEEKKYGEAIKSFKTAIDRWPDSSIEEDSLYLTAESYFFADEYTKAEDYYQQVVEKYANTRYLDTISKRLFLIARYWQEKAVEKKEAFYSVNATDNTRPWYDTQGHAVRVYEKIRLNDPRGVLADDAIMAAANIKLSNLEFEEADHLYGIIRADYPRSEFQLKAHMLGLQCKLQMYQGADYDSKPLEAADRLVDQILVQFPQDPEVIANRERLLTTKAELKAQRALREWNTAEYYRKGTYGSAARFYYRKVIDEYPGTEFAKRAEQALGEIANMPDAPHDYLAFMENVLPPKKGPKALKQR